MKIGKLTVGNVWDTREERVEYIYIGRRSKSMPGSPLQNPHTITAHVSRDEACDLYQEYLQECLTKDSEQKTELNRIGALVLEGTDVVLTCYCKGRGKPQDIKRCHGDYIREIILNAIKAQGIEHNQD